MMTGSSLHFLCAVLNSPPVSWLVSKSGLTTGMGLTQWKKFVVEEIPVPLPDDSAIADVSRAVTDLLALLDAGDEEAVNRLESSIHAMVCDLYGLTAEELNLLAKTQRKLGDG